MIDGQVGTNPIFFTIHDGRAHNNPHSKIIADVLSKQGFPAVALGGVGEFELLANHPVKVAVFDYEGEPCHINKWRTISPDQPIAPPYAKLGPLSIAVCSRCTSELENIPTLATQIREVVLSELRRQDEHKFLLTATPRSVMS